jgi:hypothetical protein
MLAALAAQTQQVLAVAAVLQPLVKMVFRRITAAATAATEALGLMA